MNYRFLYAALLFASAASLAQDEIPSMVGKFTIPPNLPPTVVPFTLEGDQILVEVEVEGSEKSEKITCVLNMGQAISGWMKHVWKETGHIPNTPARFRIGGIPVEVASGASTDMDDAAYPDRQVGLWFFTHPVEGVIQAGFLQNFDIALDYRQKTLTLAAPGTLPHDGVAVPIRVKPETGLVTVDFIVDGKAYPMVVDVGGPYTWTRPSTAAEWLKAHPDWRRAEGAVGAANYIMAPVHAEQEGTLMRLPEVHIGPLEVANVGVLGADPRLDGLFGLQKSEELYDAWQQGAAEPVVAWLGANVLKHYRITIDYKAHMSWWKKTDDIDPHELDQVGISFVYDKGDYSVGRIATKDGKPTASGVEKGDKIVSVDDAPAKGWSRGQLYAALGGKPGDLHKVTVDRDGKLLTLSLPVTAF